MLSQWEPVLFTLILDWFFYSTLHDVQCYGNNSIKLYTCGLHLKDAVPHSPSEASRLSSITTAWDSLSNELKKQVSFFFREVGLQWGKPAVSHCLHMVNEPVFNIQLLQRISLIKHICCCAAERGWRNFLLKMKN